ncbi:hypothetical protein [Actinosynnema sp. NPDC023587]|uniref:hypothetical protein n=1 Tax=Actinosynnema sp. NPDC023587 TaxID=3154695 RepID=UPI0033EC7510
MSVKSSLAVAAALAGAAAAGAALLLPREDSEPLPYPDSEPDATFDDAQRLSSVTLPRCARGSARYHVGSAEPGPLVAMDFTAPDECVDDFLAALGVATAGRRVRWNPVTAGGAPPIEPPAGSGAPWEFLPGQRVELWSVEVGSGARRRHVVVCVNRSTFPQQVCLRSYPVGEDGRPAGQARAATRPVAAARTRHSGE